MRTLLLLTILLLCDLLIRVVDLNFQVSFAKDAEDALREQIELGNDINAFNDSGDTPLHHFSSICNPDWIKALIAAGADVNKLNIKGKPPLYYSIRANCFTVSKILIDEGANVRWKNKKNGFNHLHYASVWASDHDIHMLIRAGADVNGLNHEGESPIRVLLTWNGVSQDFKIERKKFLQRYGGKDVYLRLSDTYQTTKSTPNEPKKTVPHKKKRDKKTRKNQQEP